MAADANLSPENILLACLAAVSLMALTVFSSALDSFTHAPAFAARGSYIAFTAVHIYYVLHHRGGFRSSSDDEKDSVAFNLHPILMTVGVVILMTESVLAYRAPPFNKKRVISTKTNHAGLSSWAALIVMAGIGIAIAHHDSKLNLNLNSIRISGHFDSTHSLFGLIVLLLVLVQIVMGFLQYFACLTSKHMSWYHKTYGLIAYGTAIITVQLGLSEYVYGDLTKFDPSEKTLGTLTLLLWSTASATMTEFLLQDPQIDSEENATLSERRALIQG